MPNLALDGLRVLDLTQHLCGPYCTKLLADYGADVIKIERPGGDIARRLGPFKDDDPDPEKSGTFAYLNTNKRSIVLDLNEPADREIFFDLLLNADLVVENFRPGVMDALGIGFVALSQRKPGISLVSISNFGQSGPYRDWAGSELVLFAMGGEMYSMGVAEREPIKMAGTAALFQAGAAAAVAAVGALLNGIQGGTGEHLDIAIYEAQFASVDRRHQWVIGYQYTGRVKGRNPLSSATGFPSGVYPCADGFVEITGGGRWWRGTVAMLGSPDELGGPEWTEPGASLRSDLRERFDAVFYPWLAERTKRQVWEAAEQSHVLAGPLYTIEDLFTDPAIRERGFFVDCNRQALGHFTMPGRPFIMNESPWALRRPAPLVGEHTDEILAELKRPVFHPRTSARGTPSFQPFAGVRVLDLTVVWAGPMATMLLSDLGAEVIKVENIHVWQTLARGALAHPPKLPPNPAMPGSYPNDDPGERPWNTAANSMNTLRNKLSVTIDLRVPEGRRTFEELVCSSDVVYENNVTETMDKLGITYAYLQSLRPDIIFVRAPAFASTGPYRNRRAFGVHLEGVTGHSLLRTYRDLDPSTNTQIYAGDFFAGTHGAFVTIAALIYRRRTGRGQLIELPQVEAAAGMLAQFMMDYALNGRLHETLGNRDYHGAAPCGVYPCSGDDRWIAITVCDDEQWRNLCDVLGAPELATDPRFASASGRHAYQDDVDALLPALTRGREARGLAAELQALGIAAGPVMDARDAFEDQHLRERGMLQRRYQEDTGEVDWIGPYIHTSAGALPVRRAPALLGQDNEYVYRDLLGYSGAEYGRLIADGHIGDRFDDSLP
jgi:crotonobetainyl-CoA:carnitine CoA-transferase CaiB-like acyl-CoA transferase